MLALDLFPAIMSAGLSGYAQIVLSEVLLLWAGPRKEERFYLIGSELGLKTGLDRNNARRAINELVEANILREDGGGFVFNKDYDTWTPKPGPLKDRLDGRLMTWIKESVDRCGVPKKHRRSSNNSESTRTHLQASERVYPDSLTSVGASLPGLSQTDVSESTQTQPHIEDRVRDQRREERGEKGEGGETPTSPSRTLASLGPEYTEVGHYAIEISGDWSWGRWVNNRGVEGHPAKLIRQAIEEADGCGKLDQGYTHKILKRCAREGIEDMNEGRQVRKTQGTLEFKTRNDPPPPKLIRAGDPLS